MEAANKGALEAKGTSIGLHIHLPLEQKPNKYLTIRSDYRYFFIRKLMLEERRKGKGVLLISTELSEIFELSDRIAIMYKGRIMGIYRSGELSTEQIGLLMAGYTGKEAG